VVQTRSSAVSRRAALVAVMASLLAALVCWLVVPAPIAHAAAPGAPQVNFGQDASIVAGRAVAAAPTPSGSGFWVAWSNGTVTPEGAAHFYGDASAVHLTAPVVGIAATATGYGYWLLGADGGVFSFGDAKFYGSTGNVALHAPALQMGATYSGKGYDFVAGDGGIFTFGDARFHGSTGGTRLNRPVVGMSSTPDGRGYWLVASDGGIFSFGNAAFHGSTGAMRLAQPVIGMARTTNGGGYWLLASDGGIFTFGNAGFHGSGAGQTGGYPAVGLVSTGDGGGYWIVLGNGQILAKGNAAPMSGPTSASPSYTFEVTNAAGKPVRWDPRNAIPYAVITTGASAAARQADVAAAIAQVHAETGIVFVLAAPAAAKLTFSWVPTLSTGDQVGWTQYAYYNIASYAPEMISAQIQLLSSLTAGAGSTELPVLLHELGHAMGLGHTPGLAEVMNPYDIGLRTYQAGDLSGLWHLGSAMGSAGFYE